MTKQTIIPAGYRITITSWENDADNYKDTIHEGLSKERVEYIIELCKLFKSGSNNGGKTFGNMHESSRNVLTMIANAEKAVRTILEKYRAVLNECELENLEADKIGLTEIVSEFIGFSEDYIFRVYSKAKVEHIPHQITMEDVTGDFNV